MQSLSRQKILGFVLLIVIFVAGIYYYNLYGGSLGKVKDIITSDNSTPVGEDIIILVQKLNQINIDDSIFTSALFTHLVDFTVIVNPEDRSRPNPFAPIYTAAAVQAVVNSAPTPTAKTKTKR